MTLSIWSTKLKAYTTCTLMILNCLFSSSLLVLLKMYLAALSLIGEWMTSNLTCLNSANTEFLLMDLKPRCRRRQREAKEAVAYVLHTSLSWAQLRVSPADRPQSERI